MNRRDALKSLLTLPAVNAVQIAQVKPEDTIVITADQQISDKTAQRIKDVAQLAFPNSKVIVLSDGLTLSVVRAHP